MTASAVTSRSDQAAESGAATFLDADALLDLGLALRERGYQFVTPTPSTCSIVAGRPATAEHPPTLRDIFGWTRSFAPDALPEPLLGLLRAAQAAEPAAGGQLRAGVRFSTLAGMLFVHSAYPTDAADAVFFGPDTYRFAALINRTLAQSPLAGARPRILDLGCGSGAGGMAAARACMQGAELLLSDINPAALAMARVNARLNAVAATIARSDLYAAVEGSFDLITANPPYLCDDAQRSYRDGKGHLGTGLALRIVEGAAMRLAPGGALVLYTGSPMVAGEDVLLEQLRPLLQGRPDLVWQYDEIDPDVFGDELAGPAYDTVERIAAVALVLRRQPERRKPGVAGMDGVARPWKLRRRDDVLRGMFV